MYDLLPCHHFLPSKVKSTRRLHSCTPSSSCCCCSRLEAIVNSFPFPSALRSESAVIHPAFSSRLIEFDSCAALLPRVNEACDLCMMGRGRGGRGRPRPVWPLQSILSLRRNESRFSQAEDRVKETPGLYERGLRRPRGVIPVQKSLIKEDKKEKRPTASVP